LDFIVMTDSLMPRSASVVGAWSDRDRLSCDQHLAT
jgi:hypothetical protein